MPTRENIGGIFVDFDADTREYVRKIRDAIENQDRQRRSLKELKETLDRYGAATRSVARKIASLRGALGAGGLLGAFTASLQATKTFARDIEMMSRKMELSVGKIQNMRHAMRGLGLDAREVDELLTDFTASVGRASANAMSDASEAFGQLNINVKQLLRDGYDLQAIFEMVTRKLGAIGGANQVAIARSIFGSGSDAFVGYAGQFQQQLVQSELTSYNRPRLGQDEIEKIKGLKIDLRGQQEDFKASFGKAVARNADLIASGMSKLRATLETGVAIGERLAGVGERLGNFILEHRTAILNVVAGGYAAHKTSGISQYAVGAAALLGGYRGRGGGLMGIAKGAKYWGVGAATGLPLAAGALAAGGAHIGQNVLSNRSAQEFGAQLAGAYGGWRVADPVSNVTRPIGGFAGSLAGFSVGAKLGAGFGPYGALIGGGIGSIAGYSGGGFLGDILPRIYASRKSYKAIGEIADNIGVPPNYGPIDDSGYGKGRGGGSGRLVGAAERGVGDFWDDLNRQREKRISLIRAEIGAVGELDNVRQFEIEKAQLLADVEDRRAEIMKTLAQERASDAPDWVAIADMQQALTELPPTGKTSAALDEQLQFLKTQIDLEDQAGRLQKMAGDFQNTFQNAFEGMITGAEKAREAIKNLVRELINAALRYAIIDPAAKALAGKLTGFVGGGGEGGRNFVGPPAPGRAFGGAIWPGQNYLVGERGPEIISTRGGGFVTPNSRIGSFGGSGVNVTLNMAAGMSEQQVRTGLDGFIDQLPDLVRGIVREENANNIGGRG